MDVDWSFPTVRNYFNWEIHLQLNLALTHFFSDPGSTLKPHSCVLITIPAHFTSLERLVHRSSESTASSRQFKTSPKLPYQESSLAFSCYQWCSSCVPFSCSNVIIYRINNLRNNFSTCSPVLFVSNILSGEMWFCLIQSYNFFIFKFCFVSWDRTV